MLSAPSASTLTPLSACRILAFTYVLALVYLTRKAFEVELPGAFTTPPPKFVLPPTMPVTRTLPELSIAMSFGVSFDVVPNPLLQLGDPLRSSFATNTSRSSPPPTVFKIVFRRMLPRKNPARKILSEPSIARLSTN
jgi:hypothetical protein